jgi:hypothetical protein
MMGQRSLHHECSRFPARGRHPALDNRRGFWRVLRPAIQNLLLVRDIPMVMGFPPYGRGPFERVGLPTTVPIQYSGTPASA